MDTLSPPLQFLLLLFSGWVNRQQADVIAYLQEENRVLREQLGGHRLRLMDERRRLAVKGVALGRKVLREIAGLVVTMAQDMGTCDGLPCQLSWAMCFIEVKGGPCLHVPLSDSPGPCPLSMYEYVRDNGQCATW